MSSGCFVRAVTPPLVDGLRGGGGAGGGADAVPRPILPAQAGEGCGGRDVVVVATFFASLGGGGRGRVGGDD